MPESDHIRSTDILPTAAELARFNQELAGQPEALIAWGYSLGGNAVVTTSFGPFSGVILHMVAQQQPRIPVLWMDSGYNTPEAYRYADELTRRLDLNLQIARPRRSRAHREAADGPTPAVGTPEHDAFTREVKLEPFERALLALEPRVWFTGLRAEETAERARMQAISLNQDGFIKVAPLLNWTSKQLHEYLKQHDLPNNFDYYDPTKGDDDRECGLHVEH